MIFCLRRLDQTWPDKNKTGFPEAADVTASLFRKPDLGTNSKIRKDGGFCLHAPASICALVFIDGEAGEQMNITYRYDKDNMHYFLKPPFSPYLKFQTGVHTHTPLYR